MRHLSVWVGIGILSGTQAFAGPVVDAAKTGDASEIQQLLDDGGDANEDDPIASPLHWAALKGHSDVIDLLIARGADLNASSDMLGAPLHAAAQMGHAQVVDMLIAAGADPDVRDRNEFTPLIRAVMHKRGASVAALISGGADVDAIGIAPGGAGTGKGPTIALHLASHSGQAELVEALRAAGAGPIPPEVPDELASMGDPERGRELVYTYCTECHIVDPDDPPQVGHRDSGPPLIGVIGRPVADLQDFEYSEALKAHGGDWTPERLYTFALRPMLTVPGTKMNWAAGRTPEMIADITAYFVSVAY